MIRSRRILLLASLAAVAGGAFALREASRSEAAFAAMHPQAPVLAEGDFLHHGGHGHTGASALLGRQRIAGFDIEATRIGTLRGAALGTFAFAAEHAPAGTELTAWIGTGAQPRAARAVAVRTTDGTAHAHLELPVVVTTETKLWVEASTTRGTREAAAFDLAN